MSRYVVGIDLGTTNCAWPMPTPREATDRRSPRRSATLAIPQVVGVNDVAERPVLPSFLYLPAAKEFPAGGDSTCPGSRRRTASSAPSRASTGRRCRAGWSARPRAGCRTPGVDRRRPDPALDGRRGRGQGLAGRGVGRLPRRTCATPGTHQVAGKTAADRLENQDVLLTVPASFDAVARELTVEAARPGGARAGHAAGGAAGRLLRLARRAGRRLAEAGQGRRHPPGLRRRRRDDRLHPDRRDRRGGRPGPDPPGRRRAHPARRRQHGPGPGPRRRRHAAPAGWTASTPAQRVALGYACRTAKETLFAEPEEERRRR